MKQKQLYAFYLFLSWLLINSPTALGQAEDVFQTENKMIRMINNYDPSSLHELKNKVLDVQLDVEDRLFSLYLLQLSNDPLKDKFLNEIILKAEAKIKKRAQKYKNELAQVEKK